MPKRCRHVWSIQQEPERITLTTNADLRPWRVRLTFERPEGPAVLTAVAIERRADAGAPGDGLSAPTVTALRLGHLIAEARRELIEFADLPLVPAALTRAWRASIRNTPRPGRAGRPDLGYAILAAAYAKEAAGSRNPVERLAKHYGMSASKVRDLVNEARARGLLTKAIHGRAGGELTAKGRAVLAEATAGTGRLT